MSDRALRDLERRVAEGDPGAEAPLLVARLRAGSLAPRRLRLAAYLGHAPAREALGAEAPRLRDDLESWMRGLADWGPEAWVRAAVAAGRLACVRRPPIAMEALEAAEAWVEEPSEAHHEACLAQAELANANLGILEPLQQASPRDFALWFRESRAATQAALSATEDLRGVTHAVLAGVAARERLGLSDLPDDSPMWVRAANVGRLGELPELSTRAAVAAVREAVRAALLPWALGE